MWKLKSLLPVFLLIIALIAFSGFSELPQSNLTLKNQSGDTKKHYIGELFGGGIIYFIDSSGLHGRICSLSDLEIIKFPQLPGITTKNQKSTNPFDDDQSIIKGSDVISCCDSYTNSNYSTGIYSDWILPTIDDLETLFKVRDKVNQTIVKCDSITTGPLFGVYWSSTKINDDRFGEFWLFDLNYGSRITTLKPNSHFTRIRAIRAF